MLAKRVEDSINCGRRVKLAVRSCPLRWSAADTEPLPPFPDGRERLMCSKSHRGEIDIWWRSDEAAQRQLGPSSASSAFPPVLRFGVGDGLPLQVGNRVRASAGERFNVILTIAGTSATGSPGRRARMLSLEFPRHLTRPVFSG